MARVSGRLSVMATTAAMAASFLVTASLLAAEGEAPIDGAEHVKPVIPPTIWGILVFVTVLGILLWKAFPPITEALEKRARLIRESLEAAQRAKAEAEAMMARHQESLEKARTEARAIIEESKTAALKVRDGIVESARKDAEEMTERARREIELAKRSAVDELHRQAARLSIEIANKVIRKSLREEDHQQLIQESIRRYQEARPA